MPHELKVSLWPLKFWRMFSTWRKGIKARGLSQRYNAEILSCYELLSCKESSKCSVAMLTYGEFCCNQSCCDAGGHLGVTSRLVEIWTCDIEISDFWIYKPLLKTSNVSFSKDNWPTRSPSQLLSDTAPTL